MTITVVFNVAVVLAVLFRQRRIRRVRARPGLFGPVVIGLIGLYQLGAYTNHHRLTAGVTLALLVALFAGAAITGGVRALTVRVWSTDGLVLRQATWLTMGLWAASLLLHFSTGWWIGGLSGPSGVAGASLLLYLGLTDGVQAAAVQHRARPHLVEAAAAARPAVIDARWWEAAWGKDAPGGGDGPGGPAHPGAIEARAEPLDPRPPGKPEGDEPG